MESSIRTAFFETILLSPLLPSAMSALAVPHGSRQSPERKPERDAPAPLDRELAFWFFDSHELLSGREEELWREVRRLLARAVARVLTHELIHAVAPSLPHSAEGLMSQRLTRRLLMEPDVALVPRSVSALRASLRRWIEELGRRAQ